MIAKLSGILSVKEPTEVVVETSGVGYALTVPISTFSVLPAVGETVELWVHTYVREDQLALFGFATADERRLFRQLLSVSGIGPKVALAILSVGSPAGVRGAIGNGDTTFIASVPGVGKKTAERVVVDLRDRVGSGDGDAALPAGRDEVVEALIGLGYAHRDARQAVLAAATSDSTEDVLKSALKHLAK